MMAEKQSSYSFASDAATGAALGRAAGTASAIATGSGSGSAPAKGKIIMATAIMTSKGFMLALIAGDEVCGR